MTKDEIKKALEICNDIYAPCNGCPYEKCTSCDNALHTDALNVIVEQEKEIAQLKANWYRSIMDAFENNRDKIVENIQTEIDDYKQSIKRAKIDMLNEVKERLDNAPNGWAYTTYIDELIEEVENETKKETSRITL